MGFANCYWHFLWGFSSIAAPLTALLKKGTRKLQLDISANQAFEQLKKAFTTAHILRHPDPTKPIIVKVDALEFAVGAVLSQRSGVKLKHHPTLLSEVIPYREEL